MNKEESLNMLALEKMANELITPKMKRLLDIVEDSMKFKGLTYDAFTKDLADALVEMSEGKNDSSKEARAEIVDKAYDKLIEKYGNSSNTNED